MTNSRFFVWIPDWYFLGTHKSTNHQPTKPQRFYIPTYQSTTAHQSKLWQLMFLDKNSPPTDNYLLHPLYLTIWPHFLLRHLLNDATDADQSNPKLNCSPMRRWCERFVCLLYLTHKITRTCYLSSSFCNTSHNYQHMTQLIMKVLTWAAYFCPTSTHILFYFCYTLQFPKLLIKIICTFPTVWKSQHFKTQNRTVIPWRIVIHRILFFCFRLIWSFDDDMLWRNCMTGCYADSAESSSKQRGGNKQNS